MNENSFKFGQRAGDSVVFGNGTWEPSGPWDRALKDTGKRIHKYGITYYVLSFQNLKETRYYGLSTPINSEHSSICRLFIV